MNTNYRPVILPPVLDRAFEYNNLEPQVVKVRSNNLAKIYIDSQFNMTTGDATNINLSSASNNSSQIARTLIGPVSRLAIAGLDIYYVPITISPYNKTINFYVTDNNTLYTFDLTVGKYYSNSNSLITDVLTGMNTAYTGATFTASPDNRGGYVFNISAGVFRFDPVCPMAVKGKNVLGLPLKTGLLDFRSLWTVGPCRLLYTKYFDLESPEISKYSKNPSVSINARGNQTLFRGLTDCDDVNRRGTAAATNLIWQDWNYGAIETSITILFFDENGDPFYTYQNAAEGTQCAFNWNMTIITES